MASAEQPLKKRKLYEQFMQSSPSPPQPTLPPSPPPPPQQQQPPPPGTPPAQPLSQEEILRRQGNLEEIRNVYNCLKQIKCCIAQEEQEPRHLAELEQAYLYLINASRGCSSVQRIIADLIPRYASYCSTPLEAAAKVVINMHNCSLAVISNGEDFDGVAYETAEACIFGLVDICRAAAKEAPTSSFIQGICSAVFMSVFTFFISSFEGKDIFQIIDKESLKILDAKEFISVFKEKFLDDGDSTMLKLSKFRAVSFLWLFFSCPKYSLSACFELFDSSTTDATSKEGHYFLRQLTIRLDDAVSYTLTYTSDDEKSSVNFMGKSFQSSNVSGAGLVPESNHVPGNISLVSRNCILGLVLGKDSSLKSWIFSRYRKLRISAPSEIVSDVTSVLDGIFESFTEQVDAEETQARGDESESSQSKYVNPYLVNREPSQLESSSEVSGRDFTSKTYDKSCPDNMTIRFSCSHLKRSSSVDYRSSASPSIDSGGSRSMDFDFGGPGESSHSRSSVPRDLLNRHFPSPIPRTPGGSRSSLHGVQREKSQALSMDVSSPTLRSFSEGINCSFDSPKNHLSQGNPPINQVMCYSDGDPAAMDIFAASKQLWLGPFGPDASEGLIRSQFEKFGPIDQFMYSPIKGFALIEYRNIMDALKARENMQGCSTWGACLRIKFSDTGFGGDLNAVTVGSTCHVYVGHVSNRWVRDEIMNEVTKVLHKGSRMATDLTSEGALLMKFDAPDEANIAMAHLRKWRRETGNPLLRSHGGPGDLMMHAESSARHGSAAILVEGSSNSGNNITDAQALPEKPTESYLPRGSHLSSIVSQLRTKYNVPQNLAYPDTHLTGNHHVASTREEQLPTSTLSINIPHMNPMFLTDDELLALCNVAINNVGSIVRLTRQNVSMGSCWFVECSSIETAKTLLNNLRDCPEKFFHIEFSHPGKLHSNPLLVKPDSNALELTSPRLKPENHGIMRQGGHAFQSNWAHFGHGGMPEVRSRSPEAFFVDPSHGGGHVVSSSAEQMWMYRKPESELHSGPRSIPRILAPTVGPTFAPPQPVQAPHFRPRNFPPNSSWDARGLNSHMPINPISPRVMPNIQRNPIPPPFIPASVTPLAQFHGNSMPSFDQMYSVPMVTAPPVIPPFPPSQPDVQPPLPPPQPPPPPPPPYSQPPVVPPPPCSPPPPPPSESSSSEYTKQSYVQYKWHGALSKSGVHYCTIYAQRVDSDICKYSDEMAEPTEWPVKLDMTKRTDFRHVKTTFSNTPPHRRELCWLLPSSQDDHKGFQDFILYLQQRECAGVIKIPAVKSMWARLLFILPYSPDVCSMLSIAPNPSLCLIGLVLPKETNFEWV